MQSRVEKCGYSPRGVALPTGADRSRWVKSALLAIALACTAATVGAGNIVEYVYDAAGNTTQIKRQSTAGLAITSVSPGSGAIGAVVTVHGAGFSPTPANNTVRFNGTTATVSASDPGSIMVTVPAGATTGRVTVTVGTSTATSPADFIVTVPSAPTVASFSPASGVAGTVVSVIGTDFDPPASVSTMLNATAAATTVASPTALTFTVPASASSGRISITNTTGTGVSASDFIVVPAGYSASDIARTVRLTAGGASEDFQLGTPSTHGLILFDGTQDTYYTLQFEQLVYSPSNAPVTYKVYTPANAQLLTGNIGYGYRPTIHLPKLPSTGTYSVLVSPGIATLSSFVSVAADPVLGIDGAATSVALSSASSTTRMIFSAPANQRIGVGIAGLTLSGATSSATYFKVYQPDGTQLTASGAPFCFQPNSQNPQGNCDGEFTTAAAGVYTMLSEPVMGYAAGYAAQLSSEVTGTLAPDVPQDFTLSRLGQDSRYAFTAAVGESLAIDLAGIVAQPHAQPFYVTVLRPNGTTQASGYASSPLYGLHLSLGTVTVAGEYVVVVDPSYGAYGSARLSLKSGPMLATTDSPASFATSVTGESQRYRFEGVAGQNLSIGLVGLAYVGSSSSSATLTVYKPDGSSLNYAACLPSSIGGRCKLALANMPVTGTYSLAIQPPAGVKLTGNISLSEDQVGSLAADTPVSLSVTRPAQNVRYSFEGTAGQGVGIELSQLAMSPSGPALYMYILRPNGSVLTSAWANSNGAFVNIASLPVTGTYTVLLDAGFGVGFTARLTLDPGIAAAVDGPTQALSTAVGGETIRYTFAGNSGDRVNLGLSGLAYSPSSGGYTTVSVYRPDGAYMAGGYCYASNPGGGCEAALPATLPSTGTYSITIAPPAGILVAGGTLAISTPLAATLEVGGATQTVAISRPSQTARYAFSGTAGQLLRLNWTGTSVSISGTSTVAVSVLKPDGSTLTSSYFGTGATGGVDIASLPATGTYTVVFDPTYAATMSAPVTLVTR